MIIETEHLRLVPPDIIYAPDIFEYSKDTIFCEFIDSGPAQDLSDSVNFLKNLIQDNMNSKRLYWVIIDKRNNKAIGTIGFIIFIPIYHKVLEFGYGLSRSYWGTGIFQEAAHEVLSFGFNSLNAQRVQLLTRDDNKASILSVQKLGFVVEAILKNFYETDRGRINSVLMRLFKDDYFKK